MGILIQGVVKMIEGKVVLQTVKDCLVEKIQPEIYRRCKNVKRTI